MSILSGYGKFKRYILTDSGYKLCSQWTSSNTVHFDDGNTAQSKVGAINGITDSLTSTNSNIALSAAAGKNLQAQVTQLNTGLGKTRMVFTSIASLGITSTYIPDIIAAMPKNSSFKAIINNSNNTGIVDNVQNKMSVFSLHSGVITIEKVDGYTRTIVTVNNTGGSNGNIYVGSINTNTKIVNGWYKIEGTPC